ncbi:MAG: hypothetical protein AAF206_01620 [Bacteroidota bacterium]
MKRIPLLLLALVMLCSMPTQSAFGQRCVGYEQQLETYFINYEPGTPVNIRIIESVYIRCDQPTAKMKLMYYFFRSVNSFLSDELSDEAAYQDARYFYQKAAAHFDYLVDAGPAEETFATLYFDRAYDLEESLGIGYIDPADLATNSRGAAGQRSRSASDDIWVKRNPQPTPSGQSRDMGRRKVAEEATFSKRFHNGNGYTSAPAEPSFSGSTRGAANPANRRQREIPVDANDPYGDVGDLGELSPREYLRYAKDWNFDDGSGVEREVYVDNGEEAAFESNSTKERFREEVSRTAGQTRGARPTESNFRRAAVDARQTQERIVNEPAVDRVTYTTFDDLINYSAYTCILDRAAILYQPKAGSQSVSSVVFGDEVARVAGKEPVHSGSDVFVQVKLRNGQAGWINRAALVGEGRVAAITGNTRAFRNMPASTARDRNAVLLKAGEQVVLETMDGAWIRVISRNAEKQGWVDGIDNLSIDAVDVEIANRLYRLRRINNLRLRQQQLEDITRLQGFNQSELAGLVREMIRGNDSPFSSR